MTGSPLKGRLSEKNIELVSHESGGYQKRSIMNGSPLKGSCQRVYELTEGLMI